MDYEYNLSSTFDHYYRCYPVSFIDKPHLENGDKIIMPQSALHHLAHLDIEYPMLFELSNTSAERITHCGVLEFIAEEGIIFLPSWMMQNMLLQDGDVVRVKNASLAKGSYAKLQPHTADFLDISNPKAILETSLRSYSCLTTGDTIMVAYNNKKFYIDIVETKPSSAVSIIETDCEVEFAPPLDYKELENPASSPSNKTQPAGLEELVEKISKFRPFTGSSKRMNGKPSMQTAEPAPSPMLKPHQPNAGNGINGSKSSNASSHRPSGKLIFGSSAAKKQPPSGEETPKVASKSSSQEPTQVEKPKFQAFTGKKYSLQG